MPEAMSSRDGASAKLKILSTASCHPRRILSNADLEKMVDTNDEWIIERTGIRERRIASPNGGEWPSDLATKASQMALDDIKMNADEIDGIICATMTPDFRAPSVACLIQKKTWYWQIIVWPMISMRLVSGFVYAFNTAAAYIRAGFMRNVLIVGTDCMSSVIDYQDRKLLCHFRGWSWGLHSLGSTWWRERCTGNFHAGRWAQ